MGLSKKKNIIPFQKIISNDKILIHNIMKKKRTKGFLPPTKPSCVMLMWQYINVKIQKIEPNLCISDLNENCFGILDPIAI